MLFFLFPDSGCAFEVVAFGGFGEVAFGVEFGDAVCGDFLFGCDEFVDFQAVCVFIGDEFFDGCVFEVAWLDGFDESFGGFADFACALHAEERGFACSDAFFEFSFSVECVG